MKNAELTTTIQYDGIGEQVYERLKEMILTGHLAPGERIQSRSLADSFRVSITPVRDALQRLKNDGLVEISPRRGVFVIEVTQETVREIFEARRIIECACVEHMDALSDEIVQHMHALVHDMEALCEDDRYTDYNRYIELDADFHMWIVQLLHNKRLAEMYCSLRWPIQLTVVFSQSKHHRAAVTIAEHTAIVAALAARDTAAVYEAISRHLRNAAQDLLQHITAH